MSRQRSGGQDEEAVAQLMKWSKNQANSPRPKDTRGGIRQKTESEALVANPGA